MADEAVGSEGFENDADEYEYETMTAAEVLEKLSEVKSESASMHGDTFA